MSVVGGFPGINASHRRTVRAQVNPMDKSTIVSIYPKIIHEKKVTVQPGLFHLEAGSYDKPAVLVVGPSSWWKEIDEEQPILEIPNSSIQVADSIVRDYCSGLLACNMSDCMPGIFWIPGNFTIIEVRKANQNLLDKAKANQERYFLALIKMADSLWARTNGNPLTISDDMRMAAKTMGAEGKDWMKDFTLMSRSNCPACGASYNSEYPICGACKTIVNPTKFKEMGLKQAD